MHDFAVGMRNPEQLYRTERPFVEGAGVGGVLDIDVRYGRAAIATGALSHLRSSAPVMHLNDAFIQMGGADQL